MTQTQMHTPFNELLAAGVRRCEVPASRILVAVSGGADSVALLRGLVELSDELQFTVNVAHLIHNLRDEAHLDANWVEDLCRKLNLGDCIIEERNIREIAEKTGEGIEETARIQRYDFLELTAKANQCDYIFVAHSADDQVETILHNILRGTGVVGLSGIPPIRVLRSGVKVVRPMLEITRQMIEDYLSEVGQSFRQDKSNVDPSYTRNRIRHELLPSLAEQYNPKVRDALGRLGRQAVEINEAIAWFADRLLAEAILDQSGDMLRLDCRPLSDVHRHLVRACFQRLWTKRNWPRKRMGFSHWDRLAELVKSMGTISLPGGIEARRRGDLLVFQLLADQEHESHTKSEFLPLEASSDEMPPIAKDLDTSIKSPTRQRVDTPQVLE